MLEQAADKLRRFCPEVKVGVKELIRDGYLCPLVTKAGVHKADTSSLHVRAGEFMADEVESLMDRDELVEAACREIVEYTRDRHAVLIFASGIKHAQHIQHVLQDHHGQECGFVSGKTPITERDATPARFRGDQSDGLFEQSALKYLVNVNVLTTGFFARMVVLEAGPRPPGQEPSIHELPPRVLETARWWADYRPGTGNLEDWHPIPTIVEHSEEAKRLLIEMRLEAEAEYSKAEASCDSVGATVWGRASEQVRKLALLYAVSEEHLSQRIGRDAVEWASRLVHHQTRRMLFMAAAHVAENPFHAMCLKLIGKLRDAPGCELPHSKLLQRMKVDAKTFGMLIETLAQQGDIEVVTVPRPGWPVRSYRLASGVNLGGER